MSRKPLSGIQKQPHEMFCKKVVLKNFANFTGIFVLESFLNKDAGLQDCNFIEKRQGAKVGPGPTQSLKVRPQDPLQSLKVGPLHLS